MINERLTDMRVVTIMLIPYIEMAGHAIYLIMNLYF